MTLFVAGVHAVGKTHILQPVCERLGFIHATASQLIKEQKGLANWTVSRQVADIEDNQKALAAAIERLQAARQTLVLDGHFVLRRGPNVHEAIGLHTFCRLKIRGALLLEAPPQVTADRLLQRAIPTGAWQSLKLLRLLRRRMPPTFARYYRSPYGACPCPPSTKRLAPCSHSRLDD